MGKVSPALSSKFSNMSFVSALVVVLVHCYQEGDKGTAFWWFTELVGGGKWLTGGLVRFAVPFFFLASGFFLAGHIGERGWWKRALLTRVRTLLVPYFAWLTVACLLTLAYRTVTGDMFPDIRWWLKSYGIVNQGFPILKQFWFLKCLYILIVLSPLLFRCAKPILLVVLFCLYGIVAINPFHLQPFWTWLWGNTLSIEGGAFFTLGIYLRRSPGINIEQLPHWFWGGTVALTAIFLIAYAVLDLNGSSFALVFRWAAVPVSVVAVWGVVPCRRWPRWLTAESFPIYLTHLFFVEGFSRFVSSRGLTSESSVMFSRLFLIWVGSVGACILFVTVLRKYLAKCSDIMFGGR